MRFPLFAAAFLFASIPTRAQSNYEIQVYASDLVPPGVTMTELHSNFTVDGFKTKIDGVLPDNHAEHETLEITHGFDEWFETGFYVFTSIQNGTWYYVGSHIRPRIAVPEKYHLPVGLSLSTEFGWVRPNLSADTWTWEIRPIVDKKIEKWYLCLNITARSARLPASMRCATSNNRFFPTWTSTSARIGNSTSA
jgi:hypothetical protein